MKILGLFVTASIPVLKVLLITTLGSYLALDRVGIFPEDARKHLNTVVFYVFNPALVGSNLANTITYQSMITLWFMPVNILIAYIVGSILGWIVIQITRPSQHLRGLILGCSAAGNFGTILLIIIPTLCKERGSPFGDPDVCYTYGMAYSSLSMAIGSIYLWSYVYNIVRISATSDKEFIRKDFPVSKAAKESSRPDLEGSIEPLLSSTELEEPGDNSDRYVLPLTASEGRAEAAVPESHLGITHRFRMLVRKLNLKALLAPSTTGTVVGFVIGLVPQIRKTLIGTGAPLRVIQDSASLLGDGAIPALTLIIGGNLVKGLKGAGMQKSIIVGIIVARYVVLPFLGILVLKGAVHFGMVQSDPLYQFVLLLQFAVPPAMNMGESECSVIMLWTYALASISLTFWSTVFMWLVA
ncbi:Uncharacterized transporter [Morus notabilis]|uniref:Uncharacterized transporter n=1 Tax=Morus notabilis TaxID=981085 RepID=W9R6Z0_9ROSA|nr:Uncharacterized transporter [Morus notabilis]